MRDTREASEGESKIGNKRRLILIVLLGSFIFLALYFVYVQWSEREKPAAGGATKSQSLAGLPKTSPSQKKTGSPPVEKSPQSSPTGMMASGGPAASSPGLGTSPALPSSGPTQEKSADLAFLKGLKEKQTPESSALAKEAPAAPEEKKVKKVSIPSVPARVAASKSMTAKHYTIQVAALDVEKPARRLAAKLKGDGYPSYVVAAHSVDQGTIYRVRVGRYSSLPEAKRVAGRLHEHERLSFFIALTQG